MFCFTRTSVIKLEQNHKWIFKYLYIFSLLVCKAPAKHQQSYRKICIRMLLELKIKC